MTHLLSNVPLKHALFCDRSTAEFIVTYRTIIKMPYFLVTLQTYKLQCVPVCVPRRFLWDHTLGWWYSIFLSYDHEPKVCSQAYPLSHSTTVCGEHVRSTVQSPLFTALEVTWAPLSNLLLVDVIYAKPLRATQRDKKFKKREVR